MDTGGIPEAFSIRPLPPKKATSLSESLLEETTTKTSAQLPWSTGIAAIRQQVQSILTPDDSTPLWKTGRFLPHIGGPFRFYKTDQEGPPGDPTLLNPGFTTAFTILKDKVATEESFKSVDIAA